MPECKATSCACGLELCWGVRGFLADCTAAAAATDIVSATANITAATAMVAEVGNEHLGIILELLLQGRGKVHTAHICELRASFSFPCCAKAAVAASAAAATVAAATVAATTITATIIATTIAAIAIIDMYVEAYANSRAMAI